jgi:sarcosine oxidase, subunit gamma
MADGRQQGALARYAPRMSAVADDRVRLAEQPFPGQMGLRVAPGSAAAGRVAEALGAPLPETPNTVAEAGRRHVMWLGPDEWLVVEPAGAEGGTEAMLAAALAGEGAAVDLSANRTALILSGPDARAVLAGCCPLDLHPSAFPAGRCGQTLLARAQVIIQAAGEPAADGSPSEYAIYVRPSFAAYVAEWLLDGIEGLAFDRNNGV